MSEPTTQAGRGLLAQLDEDRPYERETNRGLVLAIEAEARADRDAEVAALRGHDGIVDRCRQRLAGAGFDILTLRTANATEADRTAAIDRLSGHLDEIDRILTAALDSRP